MSTPPSPLNRQGIELRLALARARFPELEHATSHDYAALAAYCIERPQCFLNLEAYRIVLAILRDEANDPNGLLNSFFQNHRSEVDIAFRALSDVNAMRGHDDLWPTLANDVIELAIVDEQINPSYLKLCEAVFAIFILPLAMRERRLRGRATADIPLHQRADDARQVLATHMEAFDRVVRNAIAHGHVAYRYGEIMYSDRVETRSMSPRQVAQLFDDMIDLCNGLAAAVTVVLLVEESFVARHSVIAPTQMVLQEVRAQSELPSWKIDAALELDRVDLGRQLTVLVTSQYWDDWKAIHASVVTGSTLERMAPGFTRYFLSIRRSGSLGWVSFDGARLATARIEAGDAAAAVDGMMLFPPFLKRWLRVPRRIAKGGTLVESLRVVWRSRGLLVKFPLRTRHLRIHRNRARAVIDITLVLNVPTVADGVAFIRRNIRWVFWFASIRARLRSTSLAIALPIGICRVRVFIADFRRRRLEDYGLGPALLCNLTLKKAERIQIVPIMTSIPERIDEFRIDWNSNAVGEDELRNVTPTQPAGQNGP